MILLMISTNDWKTNDSVSVINWKTLHRDKKAKILNWQ